MRYRRLVVRARVAPPVNQQRRPVGQPPQLGRIHVGPPKAHVRSQPGLRVLDHQAGGRVVAAAALSLPVGEPGTNVVQNFHLLGRRRGGGYWDVVVAAEHGQGGQVQVGRLADCVLGCVKVGRRAGQ